MPVQVLDDQGNLLLQGAIDGTDPTNVGFGPGLRRYALSGVYNGDFALAPPTADVISAVNPLPYWTFGVVAGSSVVAQTVADPSSASGNVLRFSISNGQTGDEAYIQQIVPINGSRNQAFAAIMIAAVLFPSSGWGVGTNFLCKVSQAYLDANQNVISTNTTSNSGPNSALNEINAWSGQNPSVPANAYYARLRVSLACTLSDPTQVYFDLCEVYISPGIPHLWLVDITTPGTYSPGFIQQAGGTLSIEPDQSRTGAGAGNGSPFISLTTKALAGAGTGPEFQVASTADNGTPNSGQLKWRYGANSFPSHPNTHLDNSTDHAYRSDLGEWFHWDGTRWVCDQLHFTQGVPWNITMPATPLAASTNSVTRASTPTLVNSDIWLVQWEVGFYVAGGGTALGAGQSWQINLEKVADNTNAVPTTIVSLVINSGASAVTRKGSTAIGALLNGGTANDWFQTSAIKTGTPGNLQYFDQVSWRHVAT